MKILILLILILIMSSMQSRISEKFISGKMSKEYRDFNCKKNNELLNYVHQNEKNACNIDDNKTNDQVNNDRLNCRLLNENKIFLKNDVDGWCKDDEVLPKVLKPKKIKEFSGLGLMQKYGDSNVPDAVEEPNNFSTFPFPKNGIDDRFLNLDNRKKNKK